MARSIRYACHAYSVGGFDAAGGRQFPVSIFTAAGLEPPPGTAPSHAANSPGDSAAGSGAQGDALGSLPPGDRPLQQMHTNLPDLKWHLNRQAIISRCVCTAEMPHPGANTCGQIGLLQTYRFARDTACNTILYAAPRRAWNDRDNVTRSIPKTWDEALAHPTLRSLTLRSSRRYVAVPATQHSMLANTPLPFECRPSHT